MDELAAQLAGSSARLGVARRSGVSLAIALVALSTLDLVVTDLAIRSLGAVEINPLMAQFLGTPWALAVKIGIPIGIVAMATQLNSWRVVNALRIVVGLYMTVAIFTIGQVAYTLA